MIEAENGELKPDPNGVKSISVLAKLLGMNPWSVHLWVQKKRIPAKKAQQVAELSGGRVAFHKFSPYIFDMIIVSGPIPA